MVERFNSRDDQHMRGGGDVLEGPKSRISRKSRLVGVLAVMAATGCILGSGTADAATTTNGSASARAWYSAGVRDYGTVRAFGSCVHADVKLALKNVNDYTWTEARACGSQSVPWDNTHRGPILSSFSSSSVQGIYVRVCQERSLRPDNCGAWESIGR